MNVQEALAIFGMKMIPETKWGYDDNRTWGKRLTGKQVIDLDWGDSLVSDRNLLRSNLDSEVLYIKHIGMVGLLGFKMRNGQFTMFAFNNPLDWRTINRDNLNKLINNYKKFVEYSEQKHHDIDSGELELWLALKTIGGK